MVSTAEVTNDVAKIVAWPDVSVVIITKSRHEQAEQAVQSVVQTFYPEEKREIVVIEETDDPRPIGGENVKYRAIPVENRGFGYARNEGLKTASHQIVAFVDDDCKVAKDWLNELVRVLVENPGAVAVGGAVFVPECGPVGQCESILGFPAGGTQYVHQARGEVVQRSTFSTCNCAAFRREIDLAGGFEEKLQLGGEDELLSRRMAQRGKILYNPRAIARHEPRDSLAGVFSWFVRRGRARVTALRLLKTRGEAAKWLTNSPIIRLLIIVGLLLWLSLPVTVGIPVVFGLYYLGILWRFRWSRKYYPLLRTYLLLPIVKVTMDLGMDVGTLVQAFRKENGGDR